MLNGCVTANSEAFASATNGPFRLFPVAGDSMEPTLKAGLDFVFVLPTDRYQGEGVYLLSEHDYLDLYRVQDICGHIVLSKDNKHYETFTVTLEQFEVLVCGLVVADVKMKYGHARVASMAKAGK